jgi:hypothetical protein
MGKNKNRWKPYTKAIESGIWWNDETQEHDYEGFYNAFATELLAAPAEEKLRVMKDYGIWFGPQR